ncbi:hypothetical protein FOZ60_014976 [Perkinsus olseni]|uniref:ATP-dependent DNA helicase n=1 Tax=Perkinsus olseni TaxID=32597 RepID=A0A7J6N7I8_PEROL|nr:hypothetical protein FOZ60_014976 [Perkinsus olseni]
MDPQQSQALNTIVSDIQSGAQRLHFITGFAGSGKTHLLRAAVAALREHDFTVNVISATALAAQEAGGETLMGFFGLRFDTRNAMPLDNSFLRCPEELARLMEKGLKEKRRLQMFGPGRKSVLVLDEIVTLHSSILEGLDIMLRKQRQDERPFGALALIVCGDALQLRGPEPTRHGQFGAAPVKPSDDGDRPEDLHRARANRGPADANDVDNESKWLDEPFDSMRGPISDVIPRYLAMKPFYTDEKSTTETRHRRVLRCRRRFQAEADAQPRTQPRRPQPTWRLWPDYTCKLREVLVIESGPPTDKICSFYGLRGVTDDPQEWFLHDHPHGTYECRSATIPPALVDVAAGLLYNNAKYTASDLLAHWRKERDEGKYGTRERNWLDLKETDDGYPNVRGNVRNLVTSLTKRKLYGLKLYPFLRKVRELTQEGDDVGHVREILDALQRAEDGHTLPEDAAIMDRANICLPSRTPKVSTDDQGLLQELAVAFTSPAMISNYVNARQIAIDCTFNVIAADCAILTVSAITAEGSAKPAMMAIVRSENQESVAEALRQFHEIVTSTGLALPNIERIVQDGSEALHNAVKRVFGCDTIITSCFFHCMQALKRHKPSQLELSIWW